MGNELDLLLYRTGVYDIPSQDVITKDSVTISVDAVVFYRVVSPLLAVCGDGDYRVTTRYKYFLVSLFKYFSLFPPGTSRRP